jgi:hypothetical protein
MGAEDAGKRAIALERNAEAHHWSLRAGERLAQFATEARSLAKSFRDDDQRYSWHLRPGQEEQIVRRRTTFEQILDDSTMALLYRIGLPIRALRRSVVPADVGNVPIISFAAELEDAAARSDDYGKFLRSIGEFHEASMDFDEDV